MSITIEKIKADNKQQIEQIAGWYLSEWKMPKERTITRLINHPNDDVLFQMLLNVDGIPAATGGLYNNVGLFRDYPKFQQLQPWVALVYTENNSRNKGFATLLMNKIEEEAKAMKFLKLYLFTFTAEALYKKNGWIEVERVDYGGHDTVVMEKNL